jgi:hypothetical protein
VVGFSTSSASPAMSAQRRCQPRRSSVVPGTGSRLSRSPSSTPRQSRVFGS